MSRGGHNWKGGATVEGTSALNVMTLARTGFLSDPAHRGGWQWTRDDGSADWILINGGRHLLTLDYSVRSPGEDWQCIHQQVPIHWTQCRFGGERPWFGCDVWRSGVHCGRRVAKLYAGGGPFACRHCYRLAYATQRVGPLERSHRRLARLHRKLHANYEGPDHPVPSRPKWMRRSTYSQLADQMIEATVRWGVEFEAESARLVARLDRYDLTLIGRPQSFNPRSR
jgi:hypothetical protein